MNHLFNENLHKNKVVFILGATGTGKSRLSIDIATRIPSEIINSDKIQVHKGLDIVANKILESEKRGVRHHLIGTIEPDSDFTAGDFCNQAVAAVEEILKLGKVPIIVGGSNSYIESLVEEHFVKFKSIYECCFIWLDVTLPVLYSFLSKRVDQMVDAGMVNEVRGMFDQNADYSRGIRRAIGAQELDKYFRDEKEMDETTKKHVLESSIQEIKDNSDKLASRQLEKIEQLRDKLKWKMHHIDATRVFQIRLKEEDGDGRGKEVNDAWMKLVMQPVMCYCVNPSQTCHQLVHHYFPHSATSIVVSTEIETIGCQELGETSSKTNNLQHEDAVDGSRKEVDTTVYGYFTDFLTENRKVDDPSIRAFFPENRKVEGCCELDFSIFTEIETIGCQELGETATPTNNLQHIIDLASYDKEVANRPFEMNQEVVKVILESIQDVWNNKELFELIKECNNNISNNLNSYVALNKSLSNGDLNNFKTTSNPFYKEFACLLQQHISTVDKLQKHETKLNEKQNCIQAWIKLLRIIFAILAVVVLIGSGVTIATVTSRLATALATTATSIPLGSTGMWIYFILNKYKNAVKAHKDIINWLNGWTQLASKDLVKILMQMANADFVVNQGTSKLSIKETKNNLNDLRVKVVDCSKNTRMAWTAVLQKIIKRPNHLDIADAAFSGF
ncbi:adenylate isopentenyltransferase 5 [Abeliophyllum distichum]|uniref:adenylate dimethylallyltransferase (ADP/ATP-dependent) n=1 Tax=Abeliophyllum distichum TaxID=126358 RepID=A0ABD1RRB8_9LAMI